MRQFAEEKLLALLGSEREVVQGLAVLALGCLHAKSVAGENTEDMPNARHQLEAFTQANSDKELIATQGTIAQGFTYLGEDEANSFLPGSNFKTYSSAPDHRREGLAIVAGLGTCPEPTRIFEAALQDERPNVNFGGALGAILWLLQHETLPNENIKELLVKLISSQYFDSRALAMLAYGVQMRDVAEAEEGLSSIEQAINFDEPYESRVSAVLASLLAHVKFPRKLEAMQDFRKYLDAGSWAVMACGPALAMMLLADREPITMDKFEASPFFLPSPEEDIYSMNGFLLANTFLVINGAEDIKNLVYKLFGNPDQPTIVQEPDVTLVFMACEGVLAAMAENPHEFLLGLLREDFGHILENPEDDFDMTRNKMGAALGIALALYFARLEADSNPREIPPDRQIVTVDGVAEDIRDRVTQLLTPVLDGSAGEAAIVALVAGATDPQIFRKFLLIYAAYQLSMGDYTYYKVLLIILAIFLIVHAKYVR